MIGIIISIISIIISIIVIIDVKKSSTRRASDEIQRYKDNEFQKEKDIYLKELDRDFEALKEIKYNELNRIETEINNKKEFNLSIQKIREDELNRLIDSQKRIKEEELNKLMNEKEKAAKALLDLDIEEWAQSAQEAANFEQAERMEALEKLYNDTKEELDKTVSLLNEFKEKRDAVNQDILRARALEEKQDFYRVQLDSASLADIQLINSIKSKFSKIDLLEKLMYDIYIKKPVDEMIKRVLGGHAPSGIYKITRLKTKEIYIGKSTDVKARWQQHAKSAFHCGTISHSVLHTTMERDGIEQFTWELLEEVPKDKLGEREKYWIEFYDSKNYGLNEKNGG